ncbi:sorting nexin 2B [Raphanus sativus]|uniref:Sorting nexin 2B n=1 Tax=Raphanus sativus TaxID=3726 RepID=A0A9W3DCI5_RAPSA|nr:sorting nexin 2B [Raphanus sativus]XP_056861490.1 sorting nexin 2B [Raphanus sativus]
MMGSENDEDSHLHASREETENLFLRDDPLSRSDVNGNHSAVSTLPPPPIIVTPADSDPLSLPPNGSSYIEPPSYADVIFSPFDDNASDDCSSQSPISPSSSYPSSSDYIKITVSSPQKEQDASSSMLSGGSTYITYLITTRTNLPEYKGSDFTVRRRFRDVVALGDRLAESYRGFCIPPRPDKSVVESQVMQRHEFVEQRRVALEKYLRRLASHPVIRNSDELKVFLGVEGKLPLQMGTDVASRILPKQLFGEGVEVAAQPPARSGRDLFRLFKELRQSVSNDWGGAKPAVVEEDKDFLEKKEKMHDLEKEIINASQQAETLVKAQQDIGETLGELGLAFIKLTKFENEEAVFSSQRARANDMKNLATAAVKASRFYRELNSQTVKHLDTLHDYLGVMMAVQGAFTDRSSALLTVQTLLSDVSSLEGRAEKLEAASSKVFGGDKSRIKKIEELKETIKNTEDAKNVAIKQYERIKENNRSEVERLDRERRADFLSMMKGFVVSQVGYAEKMANVWAKAAEETSQYNRESS